MSDRKRARDEKMSEIRDFLQPKRFDSYVLKETVVVAEISQLISSLVIASNYVSLDLLDKLLLFVAPSRPFSVYCQYKEVGVDLLMQASVCNWKLAACSLFPSS